MELEIRKEYHDKEKSKISQITYYKKGTTIWHREDGPAYQYFYEDGQLRCEEYWVNDKWHREDGPVQIRYNQDGTIAWQQYYINGKELTEKEFKMKQRLKGTLLEDKY